MLRTSSDALISITTNGYLLSEENLDRLAVLDPVEISLSVNAVTPHLRERLMGGRHEVGLAALERLARRRIRTSVSLVAWPTVDFDEMERVLLYADQFHARSLNVIGGGYTQYFPNPPVFPVPEFWEAAVRRLAPLRTKLRTPLIFQPRLFEESVLYAKLGEARVIGINPGSPASRCGLLIGDVIQAVNGEPVATRAQCSSLLALLRDRRDPNAKITVARDGLLLDIDLAQGLPDEPLYLYGLPLNDRFGIHLIAGGIPISAIRQIYRLIRVYKASRVVLVTSEVVRPLLAAMLEEFSFLLGSRSAEIYLLVPACAFYGGNIILGDLLVVEDILDAIRGHVALSDPPPDLILVPSASFNYGGWLRDIKGQPFELLRRGSPIPLELIMAPNFE
jgi:hypothetical protein